MTQEKPELIIFDLGRVLVDFDFKKVVRGLKKHTHLSEQQIRHYFETTPLWDAFERGAIRPRAFFKQMSKDLELQGLVFPSFEPLWNDIFTEMEESVAILKKLKGRYRLALLSNVNPMHWEHVVKRHSFMTLFDYPIASYTVGLRKPGHAIYHKALKISGNVAPGKAMFFDDVKEKTSPRRAKWVSAHTSLRAPRSSSKT